MVTVVFHIIFALSILKWLSVEYKKDFKPFEHWQWLAVNLVLSIVAYIVFSIKTDITGNFILHFVGGGMATAITFTYLKKSLNANFNWRIDIAALFLFVSAFGVLNELYEYALDSAGHGMYSIDRFDTWRDFLANTTGAIIVWLLLKLIKINR